MSIFDLNWFKSNKRNEELEALKLQEQQLKNELLRQEIKLMSEDRELSTINVRPVNDKPYRTIKMVNDVLTVVLNDGDILTKTPATASDYQAVKAAVSEEIIIKLCSTQEVIDEKARLQRERDKAIALQRGIKILEQIDDFDVKDGSVYLRGVNRSMPQMMVEEFLRIVNYYITDGYRVDGELATALEEDEEYQSLKRFFMWCCLNPRAEVADKLYNFLKKNAFRITKHGFFAALRNVVTLHGSTKLVQFLSSAYNMVKAVWKKNPDNYEVYLKNGEYDFIHKDNTYTMETVEGEDYYDEEIGLYVCNDDEEIMVKRTDLGEHIGNLTDLYLDLPNRSENRFTDAHTRTFDIRVGAPVKMDPKLCRWNTDDCGAEGLHFTSDEIHYVGCGDQSVLVLINPMKVVGIGESKGRCWEYFPIMTVSRDEATKLLHDLEFDTLQLDNSYALRELADLTEKAKDGFVAESKKHEFNLPHISSIEIENIVASLDEMKKDIKGRVRLILD
jgi:hypothetical protein